MDESAFIEAVDTGLDSLLSEEGPPRLTEATRHLTLSRGAKRARPRLVHRFGRALDVVGAPLVDVAIAAELIHTGSLLHDDVLDHGITRRDLPTVNALYGNQVAVLGGDLLLSLALRQVTPHANGIARDASITLAVMTRGAMWEIEGRANPRLGAKAWRHIALGKTGALFRFCGRATGHLAGDANAAEALGVCGERLGVAFQIADDLADLEGGAGKDPCADLREGNPSLLVMLAAEASPAFADLAEAAWAAGLPAGDEQVAALSDALLATGAVDRAKALLVEEVEGALSALGPWQEAPGGREIAAFARGLVEGGLMSTGRAA